MARGGGKAMVIREILEAADREIQAHRQAILRLEGVKDRILGCCRQAAPKKGEGRCQDRVGRTRRAA